MPVADKATTVTLNGTLNVKAGDALALMDKQWVTHTGGSDSQCNRCELTRVAKVEGLTVTLDRPTCREYDLEPSVSVVSDVTTSNLTVSGISFDATYPGGRNSGIFAGGVIDGLKLTDLSITNFGSRTVQVNVARDLRVERVNSSHGADIGNPGSGYGPTWMRCRDGLILDSSSSDTRHGFMGTNGSCRITYIGCSVLDGNFDTHGFDERDFTYIRCRANTVNVGNTAYLGGALRTNLFDCDLGTLLVSANTDGTTVLKSRLSNVAWQSVPPDPKARPSSGRATNVLVKDCDIFFTKSLIGELGDVDGLTFEDCRITSGPDPYTQVMALKWTTGRITFRRTTFALKNAGVYTPFVLSQTNADTFKLILEDVSGTSVGNPWSFVQLAKGFRGSVEAKNATFQTGRAGAAFIDNQGAVQAPALSTATVAPVAP